MSPERPSAEGRLRRARPSGDLFAAQVWADAHCAAIDLAADASGVSEVLDGWVAFGVPGSSEVWASRVDGSLPPHLVAEDFVGNVRNTFLTGTGRVLWSTGDGVFTAPLAAGPSTLLYSGSVSGSDGVAIDPVAIAGYVGIRDWRSKELFGVPVDGTAAATLLATDTDRMLGVGAGHVAYVEGEYSGPVKTAALDGTGSPTTITDDYYDGGGGDDTFWAPEVSEATFSDGRVVYQTGGPSTTSTLHSVSADGSDPWDIPLVGTLAGAFALHAPTSLSDVWIVAALDGRLWALDHAPAPVPVELVPEPHRQPCVVGKSFDPEPDERTCDRAWVRDGRVVYDAGPATMSVPLDASAPPALIPSGEVWIDHSPEFGFSPGTDSLGAVDASEFFEPTPRRSSGSAGQHHPVARWLGCCRAHGPHARRGRRPR